MRFVLAFFFADRGFLHSAYPKHRLSSQTLWLSILVLLSVGASYVGSGAIDLGTELDEGSVPTIPAGPYDLVPIVSPGDTIPGAPGLVVASVRDMDLNNGGQVAVGLQLEDPLTQELDSTNALYLVDDEQIRPIMGPWPGRGDVELNESGNVGFVDGATLRVANPDEILFEITVGDVVPALGAFITSDPVPLRSIFSTMRMKLPFSAGCLLEAWACLSAMLAGFDRWPSKET